MANLRVERGDRAGCQDSIAGRTLIYAEMMREVDGLSEGLSRIGFFSAATSCLGWSGPSRYTVLRLPRPSGDDGDDSHGDDS